MLELHGEKSTPFDLLDATQTKKLGLIPDAHAVVFESCGAFTISPQALMSALTRYFVPWSLPICMPRWLFWRILLSDQLRSWITRDRRGFTEQRCASFQCSSSMQSFHQRAHLQSIPILNALTLHIANFQLPLVVTEQRYAFYRISGADSLPLSCKAIAFVLYRQKGQSMWLSRV